MEKPICSFCGNDVFMEVAGGGYVNIQQLSAPLAGEPLYYSICVKCGTVNRAYIKNSQKLVQKLNKGKWI